MSDSFLHLLPPVPVLALGAGGAILLHPDGCLETIQPGASATERLSEARPIFCYRPQVAKRLNVSWFEGLDILELFAFVYPAKFCAPTPRGVARSLSLPLPESIEQEAESLVSAAARLLEDLNRLPRRDKDRARDVVAAMALGGWPWARPVLEALGGGTVAADPLAAARALYVWLRLPEAPEYAPEPPPGDLPVSPMEARQRLRELLDGKGEDRPQQADYASAVCPAFEPRDVPASPRVVLAEAGTGVGKTLGYIAPASLWAEKNGAPVWISTYTRNLQRQLDQELSRLYTDPAEKARHVVVRKGRENYLCLLNLEEAVRRIAANPREATAMGLVARWVEATRDGDMVGGDLPGWLSDLIGRDRFQGLADRRGECLFSACDHQSRCFVERTTRQARRARLVIANHALVLIQAAMGGLDDNSAPSRYVFDEGHHVFDAADNAFCVHMTAMEGVELHRWLSGAQTEGRRSRGRGLKKRLEGLFNPDSEIAVFLEDALHAATVLPTPGWQARFQNGQPNGLMEEMLAMMQRQIYARADGADSYHSLETALAPAVEGLAAKGRAVSVALEAIISPLRRFRKALVQRLDTEADTLETTVRLRIEAVCRSLDLRAIAPLMAWRDIATSLDEETPEEFVDWLAADRVEGRDVDVGLYRHWLDPTKPLAGTLSLTAKGLVITSATLRDETDTTADAEQVWQAAEARTGASHFAAPAIRACVPSPFDYPAKTKVIVVTDVNRNDPARVSSAMSALFRASNGGALGLFTAVTRLREVYRRISPELEEAGLPLYAQHVDAMDPATLVSIFREEEDGCLLGTDAVRDGVDVPGRSLRLIVFERVPWPRPTILHKARRAAWGGSEYDDRITRLRLKQAFGRLIRTMNDRGVFVMLDSRMPSRLLGAFPEGVEAQRVGLAEAIAILREHERTGHFGRD